jgi:hypothetical protein
MSKTIWVVERTDNQGEFQPVGNSYDLTRSEALRSLELFQADDARIPAMRGCRYRVMPYVRKAVQP